MPLARPSSRSSAASRQNKYAAPAHIRRDCSNLVLRDLWAPLQEREPRQREVDVYEELGAVLNGNTVELRLFLPDAGRDPTQYERGVLPRIRAIVARGTGAPYPRGQERVLVVIRNRTAMQRDGRPE